jgi:pimeloyl-ACP methyl ester carboxylesterase
VLAGEASGAWIAFDLACRAPGIVSGVLLVDGPFHPALSIDDAISAAAAGSRARWIDFEGADAADGELAGLCRRYFDYCGFGTNAAVSSRFDPAVVAAALRELAVALPRNR